LFYTEVDELQMHGIGVADIHKLKAAGVCTVRVKLIYTLLYTQYNIYYIIGRTNDDKEIAFKD
jgi:hypothetical protein